MCSRGTRKLNRRGFWVVCDWIQGTIGDRGLICAIIHLNTNILVSAGHRPSAISLRDNAYGNHFVLSGDNDHAAKVGSCEFCTNDHIAMLRMCGIGVCIVVDATLECERNRTSSTPPRSSAN